MFVDVTMRGADEQLQVSLPEQVKGQSEETVFNHWCVGCFTQTQDLLMFALNYPHLVSNCVVMKTAAGQF